MIYVHIAAYKDPELAPTIANYVNKTKFEDAVRFGLRFTLANNSDDPQAPDLGDNENASRLPPDPMSERLSRESDN